MRQQAQEVEAGNGGDPAVVAGIAELVQEGCLGPPDRLVRADTRGRRPDRRRLTRRMSLGDHQPAITGIDSEDWLLEIEAIAVA